MKVGQGLKLGKLLGIEISIDLSWIFIFLLLTWNLSSVVIPGLHPDWPVGLNWMLGIISSLLFFSSILAHEMAHSLVAKARGLDVKNITLFIFGGVSNIETEPPDPKTEFLMTIAGPLTSFALGFTFILAGLLIAPNLQTITVDFSLFLAGLGPVAAIFFWVGPVNILVAMFNLVPGFPLDGGRIVRSAVWSLTGDLLKATLWATRLGQSVAWFFMFIGVSMVFGVQMPIFGTGIVNGLWMAFIGWFLNIAAQQSYRQAMIMNLLEDVAVKKLMKDVPVIPAGLSVAESIRSYFSNSNNRAVLVGTKGGKARVLTVDDVRKIPRAAWEETSVGTAARSIKKDETVSPSDTADNLLAKIVGKEISHVPVIKNGDYLGVVGKREIRRYLEWYAGKKDAS